MRSRGLHPLSIQYAALFGQIRETEPIGRTYDVKYPRSVDVGASPIDAVGLFRHAVKMAIALGDASTPFLFDGKDSVVSTLRGVDLVEVGPFHGQYSLSELRDAWPDAVDRVEWDPVVEIHPISPVQRDRVSHVLRTGSPS